MKYRIYIVLLTIWFIASGFSVNDARWIKMANGIGGNSVKAVTIVEEGQYAVIAATDQAIYRAQNSAEIFQQVLLFPAGDCHVYSIYSQKNWIALATSDGLWESRDLGKNWTRTFNPAHALHGRCYGVFKRGDIIFVGTAAGLFRKRISENSWYRHKGVLGNQPVFDIVGNDHDIVIAAADGIYREEITSGEFQRIFSVAGGSIDDFTETDTFTDTLYDNRFIRAIYYHDGILFVLSKSGAWKIDDEEWKSQRLSSSALPLRSVQDLEIITIDQTSHGQRASEVPTAEMPMEPEPVLFAATDQGVFVLDNGRWVSLYKGMSTNIIFDLAKDRQGNIYAAADQGIFKSQSMDHRPWTVDGEVIDYKTIQQRFAHEPTIQEAHEMVVYYADVEKSKIDSWKAQARDKAFIPSLSLDFDRDASDLYHWNTGASPDELQKGKELVDWGVSLSWDLADVVWSTDQTSIDSRAKLMVELRDDLLDQATRIYFERRRLQVELLHASGSDALDWVTQMRIEELTADLDALTGGKFSESIR